MFPQIKATDSNVLKYRKQYGKAWQHMSNCINGRSRVIRWKERKRWGTWTSYASVNLQPPLVMVYPASVGLRATFIIYNTAYKKCCFDASTTPECKLNIKRSENTLKCFFYVKKTCEDCSLLHKLDEFSEQTLFSSLWICFFYLSLWKT